MFCYEQLHLNLLHFSLKKFTFVLICFFYERVNLVAICICVLIALYTHGTDYFERTDTSLDQFSLSLRAVQPISAKCILH